VKQVIQNAINTFVGLCNKRAVVAGWYNDPATGEPIVRNVGEQMALIHSEISEALEGHRKRLMDDHLPHRPMVEVELADAIIRISDLAGYLDLDLGGAVMEKLEYNRHRADHKPENRAKAGGKAF
jgi:NTP pyrophosphatase (non-canonical NTP hydrolase)